MKTTKINDFCQLRIFKRNSKKAQLSTIQTVILVLSLIVVIGIVFIPLIGKLGSGVFSILGFEEKCKESGQTYTSHLEDLKESMSKGYFSEEDYIQLRNCFSDNLEDIHTELITTFNDYVRDAKLENVEGFLTFFESTKKILGIDSSRLDTKLVYLKSAEVSEQKFQSLRDEMLKTDKDNFLSAQSDAKVAKQELEKLNSFCQKEESQNEIAQECLEKTEQAEKDLILIECNFFSKLGEFEQSLTNGSFATSSKIRQYVTAFMLYNFVIEEHSKYDQCKKIVSDTKLKRSAITQPIQDLNPSEYQLYPIMCSLINNVPARAAYLYYTKEELKSKINLHSCNYLKEVNYECSICNSILAASS